jgi:hypothetical protein
MICWSADEDGPGPAAADWSGDCLLLLLLDGCWDEEGMALPPPFSSNGVGREASSAERAIFAFFFGGGGGDSLGLNKSQIKGIHL